MDESTTIDGIETNIGIGMNRELNFVAKANMRILIADDHEMVRDTISAYLEAEGGAKVTSVADLGAALDVLADTAPFDLVLLDFNMPGMNGLAGLGKVLAFNALQRVAIITGSAGGHVAQEALDAGAIGFLPKTMAAKSLINAVRFMAAGERYVPISLLQENSGGTQHPLEKQLSKREVEVLSGLCRGLANKEIARELDLQEVTIKLHVRTLCRKLDARNRTQAAMIAKETGLY